MKLCVVFPNACSKSGGMLAHMLKCDAVNLSEREKRSFREYDLIINYGFSGALGARAIINNPQAVKRCIDKVATFKCFHDAGIPTVGFVTRKADIPKKWDYVVVRETATGKGNEGISNVKRTDPIPNGVLYTEYFQHEYEYRVVVFRGKVIARYRKEEAEGGVWNFVSMTKQGFKALDADCIKAAAALGIDYVGFDILEDEEGKYVFLEANSGPVLVEDMGKAIVKQLRNKD